MMQQRGEGNVYNIFYLEGFYLMMFLVGGVPSNHVFNKAI